MREEVNREAPEALQQVFRHFPNTRIDLSADRTPFLTFSRSKPKDKNRKGSTIHGNF
jgi:hypothetical protein